MAGNLNSKLGQALDQFSGRRDAGPAGTGERQQSRPDEDTFAGDFARLKRLVIRPTFATIGNMLQERGHEFNISEEAGGRISIHIVPAGVKKSIHSYDWFPSLSFFASSYAKTIGVHGRNMRPNSESATRGDYKPAQINQDLVEKELMKFIGEIANW